MDVDLPLRKKPYGPDGSNPDFTATSSDYEDGSWWQSDEGDTYAGWWQRVLAALIDSLICLTIVALGVLLVAAPVFTLPGYALMLCGPWIYYAYCESSPHRATPGKRALHIGVASEDGRRLTFWQASGRYWAMAMLMLISLGLESLIATFSERHQALHDIVAGSIVVDSEWP